MKILLNGAVFCLAVTMLNGCVGHNKKAQTLPQTTQDSGTCLAEFKALGDLDPGAFETYRQQFDKLNASYEVYKKNSTMMGRDANAIMTMELANKQRVICARVKNAVFLNIESRTQEINNI